ncbi:hypothetical protein [Lysinibacillus sp. NPDC096212]|uniref:hypothetical protein n=1 Tax=Lysinibacillus sp. NPDC096212 TaxID=3364135 RepID=UPI00382ECEBC
MSKTQVKCVSYSPKNGTEWGNYEIDTFIQGLLDLIEKNNLYFLVIANILEKYKNPDNDPQTKKLRNLDLMSYFKAYLIKDNEEEKKSLSDLLDILYSKTSQDVGDIRGKFLEAVIYKYAPKNIPLLPNTIKCVEAIISFEEQTLGGNDCDFDFTYHGDNGSTSEIPDYFECKATIDGMVQVGQPMNVLKKSKLKKWEYAKEIYNQLSIQAGIVPKIYFTCLNSRVEDIQTHVNNEGYGCVTILNNKDIYRMII